jgi:hypothetical protein
MALFGLYGRHVGLYNYSYLWQNNSRGSTQTATARELFDSYLVIYSLLENFWNSPTTNKEYTPLNCSSTEFPTNSATSKDHSTASSQPTKIIYSSQTRHFSNTCPSSNTYRWNYTQATLLKYSRRSSSPCFVNRTSISTPIKTSSLITSLEK